MQKVNIRAAGVPGQAARVTGYAALYDSLSEDLGGWHEVIKPGAFRGAEGGDVVALFNHNPSYILGRKSSGTLTLRDDQTGLAFEALLPATSWAADLITTIQRGDINGASFAFKAIDESWGTTTDGKPLRELKRLKLFDISVVTFPAYPQTSAAVRGGQLSLFTDRIVIANATRRRALAMLEKDR
jgi:HK97 family phage prohead protease